ncbi:MAG TPA: DUF4190 domain-containing protein [Verrucomicrobiae bacterium]|nr:DUF4190 domain-containing protein [Verrucomicrobiae bacterium]
MYRIIGADQKEYGPISAEQVRQWIADGRVNGQTQARFENGEWKPLHTFTEFLPTLAAFSTPYPPVFATGPGIGLAQKTNGMAIAGLVFGILGVLPCVCCGPIFSTLGLIFSSVALAQISNHPLQSGRAMAVAGLALSILGLIGFLLLMLFGMAGGGVRTFHFRF